jgi:hypothetical protein
VFGKTITIDVSDSNSEKSIRRELNKIGVWVTKEGKRIPVKNLETEHLMNIWFMLERKAKLLSTSIYAYPEPRGDGAMDAYLQACDYEDEHGTPTKQQVLESFSIYPHLVAEFKRRGL